MLNSIYIKGLFNLYTYKIGLGAPSSSKIHFLTAPNGYGKTTILDMISSVYSGDFAALLDIPFGEISLSFEHNEISVSRTETYPPIQEDSDEAVDPVIQLKVTLKDNGREIENILLDANSLGSYSSDYSSDYAIGMHGVNIDLFLRSLSCNYIKDDRILKKKTDRAEIQFQMEEADIRKYAKIVKAILNDPQDAQKYALKVEFLKTVVNGLSLSNKIMEVQPSFGFRMIATDNNKSIIPLERLSSGEKHIIVQLCEILFCSQEGTLILIDEPELSLHMAWQYQYLPVIKKIEALCGFQFLIATHSPQIFNTEWSLTTDLFMSVQEK